MWEFSIIVRAPDGQIYRQMGDLAESRGWWAAIQLFRRLAKQACEDMEYCESGKVEGTYSPPKVDRASAEVRPRRP